MKKAGIIILCSILFLSGCSGEISEEMTDMNSKKENIHPEESDIKNENNKVAEKQKVREFTLVADEEIFDGEEKWLFNGKLPGEEIRAQQGEYIKVHVVNKLESPVSVHFHGMLLENLMDGVPGVTQDAILPGETFTYEFMADRAGSFMYHSHQKTEMQVAKGLYGSMIIEPDEKTYDKEVVLMFDKPLLDTSFNSGMGPGIGMMSQMFQSENYEDIVVNGKKGIIETKDINENETIRFRLLNIASTPQIIDFGGEKYKIVAIDSTETEESELSDKVLKLPAGTRYDVEIKPQKSFVLKTIESRVNNVFVPLRYNDTEVDFSKTGTLEFIDVYESVKMASLVEKEYKPDKKFRLALSGMAGRWTINGKVFPDGEELFVENGDIVEIEYVNEGMMGMDHPMHLHGHLFQVIEINGKKLKNPIVQDTANVPFRGSMVIAFKADNPGWWLIHCHNLIHSKNGMIGVVKYENWKQNFEINRINSPN